MVFIVLIIPLTFISVQIFQEATGIYTSLATPSNSTEFSRHAVEALKNLKVNLNIPESAVVNIDQYIKSGLDIFIQNIGSLFTNAIKILVDTFIFLLALYYLLKDGKTIKNKIIELSPLSDVYDVIVFDKLEIATNSIIRGNLTVALVQGILTSIGFLFFGVPSAVLWGLVTVVAALVPSVGTSLVILPAIVYLFVVGKAASAFGLLVWGMLAVGLIDNVLGPKLIGRNVRLHSFLILLSILGGISFFGPIGFLLGPLTLNLFLTLFEIYFTISKSTRVS